MADIVSLAERRARKAEEAPLDTPSYGFECTCGSALFELFSGGEVVCNACGEANWAVTVRFDPNGVPPLPGGKYNG